MEIIEATEAFAALSQKTRLRIFRHLISAGDVGVSAGTLANVLDVLPNTLSTNLSILLKAKLVKRERQGRSIRYYADFDGISAMLRFLMRDCCGGRPELCSPFLSELERSA